MNQIISTLIIGASMGWCIGAAGMKAAVASRDKVLLKSSLQKADETYVYACFAATCSYFVVVKRCWFCKPGSSV
jgi:hypothetical protein